MKKGLDYFFMHCSEINSPVMRRFSRKYPEGPTCYYYLLAQIYGMEGYYAVFDEDLIDDTCYNTNLSVERFNEIYNYLIEHRKLLEIEHTEFGKVITSEAVQKQYAKVALIRVRNRNGLFKPERVDDQIWLLPKTDTLIQKGKDTGKAYILKNSEKPSEDFRSSSEDFLQSRVEKSKEEKSKSKEEKSKSKSKERGEKEESESRADTHPSHRHSGMSSVSDVIEDISTLNMIKDNLRYYGFSDDDIAEEKEKDQLQRMINRYSSEWMLLAAERASKNGLPNFKYFTEILDKWEKQGEPE